ncbi:MAG TPA: FAD-dependent oxidoreductase [Candidatus Limnocylindrales bacterium]|nr:FAD-dependent oxidoreductase [Candidatus Limnocylindrales bacterium]
MERSQPRVVIVGGGGTGGALAHDLVLRGIRVVLVERHGLTSGTTGRHHGLLHSGARYAVNDPESAVECIEENRILRRICPGSFEENDGLFVALGDEDIAWRDRLLPACEAAGIPARWLSSDEVLRLEPNVNPGLLGAVQVPDATMDALRMPLRFFATALANGADIRPYTEVVAMTGSPGCVTGVRVVDRPTGRTYDIGADIVVNAAGPWGESVGAMAGVDVPVQPSPGVLVAVRGRLCNMVVNRCHKSGDGDIVVPQRALSIIGTSSWVTDDPDDLEVPEDHVERMLDEGSKLIPAVRSAAIRAAWSAARPLIGERGASTGRELSRTFKCYDHAPEGVEGLVTISGGKGTTLRGMAELTADVVARKLGVQVACRTRDTVLLPHTAFHRTQAA